MDRLTRFLKDLIYLGMENTLGRYYSTYRAFVVDNDDPDNLHRLRLLIPEISGNSVYSYWALPKGLYSGDSCGMQILPKKGDLVWVEFERGSASRPVWVHGYRGENDKKVEESDVDDKNCFWFITPSGNVIKINDTKKYIHIKTPGGDYIELNKNSISLVTDKHVSLGKLDKSTYKAVLGEKVKDALDDMNKFIGDFNSALQTDLTASATQSFLVKSALSAAAPGLSQLASGIQSKLNDILSDKVSLE